jgi:cytochrome c oxidase assembly protein subunit 15
MTVASLDPSNFATPVSASARRATPGWVCVWLWTVAGLVILMVMVGGATRLTGSGLSITQWRPIAGALPPLSPADWSAEFARYQASSQYRLLNAGMSLADFKSIYWWEWGHRQLGRFIGFVYGGVFLLGLAMRALPWRVGLRLALMGLLLGFQGLIGWIMVASGLKAGMTAVEPLDLAAHLLFASLFLATLVAMATSLRRQNSPGPAGVPSSAPLWAPTWAPTWAPWLSRLLLGLILLQLVFGALVAGSHAGLVYNSWPTMDGRFLPPLGELFASSPWWTNIFENVTLIQLDHRLFAYAVLALAFWNAAIWSRRGHDRGLARLAVALAFLVLAQVGLGIVTLLFAVPLAAALAHQLLAMLVLAVAVRLVVRSGRLALPPSSAALPAAGNPLAAHVATR